jgi:phosphate transport system substrate-binding protein
MKRSYLSVSKSVALLAMSAAATLSAACGSGARGIAGEPVRIDGSSTVYPITSAVAEDFKKEYPQAKVEVAFSGTSSGFERFCKGDIDIQDASRPIEAPEIAACKQANVGYIELPVAHDGLTIIVHPSNDFAASMTVEELKTLWAPGAEKKVTKWSQVRKGWPDRPIALYGPGPKSGTFDFFTATINGKERESRKDYEASEDDQAIVKGVAGNPDGLGYVGFGYYETHKSTLKAVAIDDGDQEIGPGAIEPSPNTVRRGLYRPLSRPLFIYVNTKRLDRPEVKAFVNYYVRHSETLAAKAGGIPLNGLLYGLVQERVNKKLEGSLYEKPDAAGRSIEQLLNQ